MKIKTSRLTLQQLQPDNYESLCKILQDKDVMYAYEHAFDDAEVKAWYDNQCRRYREDGYGLWAVLLNESKEMIGQCGLTNQVINNQIVVEVGYLFQKAYWHQGYAKEAAWACVEYAFDNYPIDAVYSIIRTNNYASINVAKRNGFVVWDQIIKHYYGIDMPHDIYKITRTTYNEKKAK